MAELSKVSCLVIIFLSVAAATHIREYNPRIAVPIPPVEGPISWCTWGILFPAFEHGICAASGLDTPYAPYLGLIIAGQAEFPWIVDVSNDDLYEEQWAIGNLVSSLWVVTVGHVFQEWSDADQCGPSYAQNYKVRFCANYLHEDLNLYAEIFADHDVPINSLREGHDGQGVRHVVQLVKHPLCTRFSREWDLMMVKVSAPINPIPPEIGYIPFPRGGYGDYYLPRTFPSEINRKLCYVATYGRPFRDLDNPINKDFKSKYRVYLVDWTVCRARRAELCSLDGNYVDLTAEWFFDQGNEDYGGKQLQCWEMRNYNGALCNHDHGAPIVCGGEVVAFVVRGVNYYLCRSGSPYPIVAVKVEIFPWDFFNGKPLGPQSRPTFPTTPFFIPLNNFTRPRAKEINWQQYAPFWKN